MSTDGIVFDELRAARNPVVFDDERDDRQPVTVGHHHISIKSSSASLACCGTTPLPRVLI